jgi:NDP-sugar pyrophosphorylase family protein
MLHVIIPMAGLGSRFSAVGYTLPKPLIDVAGRPMIRHVIENLKLPDMRLILIVREEHLAQYPDYFAALKADYPLDYVTVRELTEGACCTVLMAKGLIDNDTPLLMANCDQYVDASIADFVSDAQQRNLDGSILTFIEPTRDPKWSYVATDERGAVTEAREKVAISDRATVGIYYFRKGSDFVAQAERMIAANDRVNNEFYVCPVYNYQIAAGGHVGFYDVPMGALHGMGTPDDLTQFLDWLKRAA